MLTIAGATISLRFPPDCFTHLYCLSDLFVRTCDFYPVMKVSVFIEKSNERGIVLARRLCWWGWLRQPYFQQPYLSLHPPPSTSQRWLTSPEMAPDSVTASPEVCQGLWLGKAKWARVITFFTQTVGIRKQWLLPTSGEENGRDYKIT